MSIARDDLARTDFSAVATGRPIPPTPPAGVLHHEFMAPLALSACTLAVAMRLPAARIESILYRGRAISPETARRLACYFGTSVDFWTALEAGHIRRIAGAAVGSSVRRRHARDPTAGGMIRALDRGDA